MGSFDTEAFDSVNAFDTDAFDFGAGVGPTPDAPVTTTRVAAVLRYIGRV